MHQLIQFLLIIFVLILGIPLGNLLAKYTKEELKQGKKWFILIILFCFVGVILSLILKNDYLLFSLLFIAIVTSRSLK
ncbi:hypothetical protein J4474_03710 [Candidatus Pacearchaeota archaeon]|nr:hypothetical protein [Candidatus Pacearchaeota archaeon]